MDCKRDQSSVASKGQNWLATFCLGFAVPSLLYTPFFNLDLLFPITVDSRPSWNTLSIVPSSPLLNNVLLMTIFMVHHSILKKPINEFILRYFPPGTEKSFYSLVSGVFVYMMYLCWLPMTDYKLWDIQTWWLYYGVIGLSFLSFFILLKVTFLTTMKIEDLDLYGTSATNNSKAKCSAIKSPVSKRPSKVYKGGIYGYIRHPMMTFYVMTFCVSPTMTAGHALWSGFMTLYIISAVIFLEEPALIKEFGDDYKQYMKEVPRFIPDLRKLVFVEKMTVYFHYNNII